MTDKIWYVAEGGQSVGPMGVAEIRQGLSSGRFDSQPLVFKQGMADWTPAGQVPELSGPVGAPATPDAVART